MRSSKQVTTSCWRNWSRDFQESFKGEKEQINLVFICVFLRYEALHEPVQIRRENLEDSLLLHQFNRQVIQMSAVRYQLLSTGRLRTRPYGWRRNFPLLLPRILELRWRRFKISSRSTSSLNLRYSPTTKWLPSWSPRRSRWSVRRTLLLTTSR